MIVVYFERRFGVGREQGRCGPAEWKDLVYDEHIVSMNDNGMQSDIVKAPAGRDRQEDRRCRAMVA